MSCGAPMGAGPLRGEDETPGSDWPRSFLFLSFPSLSLLLLREEKVQKVCNLWALQEREIKGACTSRRQREGE